MESSHIRSSVGDDQVCLVPLEKIKHLLRGLFGGDVAHHERHSRNWSHLLQIYRCDSNIIWIVSLLICLVKLLREDLGPRARS